MTGTPVHGLPYVEARQDHILAKTAEYQRALAEKVEEVLTATYADHEYVDDAVSNAVIDASEVDLSSILRHVNHGSTASTPRPETDAVCLWSGTVEPDNWVDGDLWVDLVAGGGLWVRKSGQAVPVLPDAEAATQAELEAEALARSQADEALQGDIDQEVLDRAAGDAALQSELDDAKANLADLVAQLDRGPGPRITLEV